METDCQIQMKKFLIANEPIFVLACVKIMSLLHLESDTEEFGQN
jgi:hypothetical protein